DVLVELGVDRRAQPGRNPFGDDLDHRAHRGAGLADAVEIFGENGDRRAVRRDERVLRVVDNAPFPARAVDLSVADGDQRAAHAHAGHDQPRQRTGGDPGGRLARRGTAAAAIVADAVFFLIGEVSVARAELAGDLAIVLRALV